LLGGGGFDLDYFPAGVIPAGGANVMRLFFTVALRTNFECGDDYLKMLSSFSLASFGIFSFWLRRHFILSFLFVY